MKDQDALSSFSLDDPKHLKLRASAGAAIHSCMAQAWTYLKEHDDLKSIEFVHNGVRITMYKEY